MDNFKYDYSLHEDNQLSKLPSTFAVFTLGLLKFSSDFTPFSLPDIF